MRTFSILLVLSLSSLSACSTREERARALQDLEKTQQQLVDNQGAIRQMEGTLNNAILELEVAKDDLQQVKRFQFLRTETEREQQIRYATQRILNIQKNIDAATTRIEILRDSTRRYEVRILRLKETIKG